MGKLVRDLIPDLILRSGRTPRTRHLDETEFTDALHEKLLEEAEELRTANPDKRLEEAADVYEVLSAIARTLDADMDAVAAVARRKRAERGGFEHRIYLED